MVRWIGPTTGHNELVEKSFLERYNRIIGEKCKRSRIDFCRSSAHSVPDFRSFAVQREPFLVDTREAGRFADCRPVREFRLSKCPCH